MTENKTADEVREHVLAQTNAYLEHLRSQDWDAWIGLWAEDSVLEFPYSPRDRIRTYRGKDLILEYMKGTTESVVIDGVLFLEVFPTVDPEKIVVELQIDGHLKSNGADYDQRYVTFFEFENGLIKHYREYWDPTLYPEAMGDPDAWAYEPGR